MNNNKKSLYEFLTDCNKVIIPDIQRDYVMGSGQNKLTSLFKAMIEKAKNNEDFEFSCILAYKNDMNNIFIYDGQQRLATLVYLCAKKNEIEKKKDINDLLQKFEFTGRDLANTWIKNPSEINKNISVDFTTFSISTLIETFEKEKLEYSYYSNEKISLDFLLNKVKFDIIFVDKVGEAEQFFMDINDGLELKDYEIYKAELYHHARGLLNITDFKDFALKMENEWLEFFLNNKSDKRNEEESLVYFLKYCFRMMWIEEKRENSNYKENNVYWIEEKHLFKIKNIIDSLLIYFEKENEKEISNSRLTCINYSTIDYLYFGEHWNITDNNYIEMLKKIINNLNKTEETKKDVVMWCFLSNLDEAIQNGKVTELYEYLRFVKKVLNNDRGCNTDGIMIYGEKEENHKLCFSLYFVKGIPNYYIEENYYRDKINKDINKDSNCLNTIIICNKEIKIENVNCYAKHFLGKCKDNILKEVLQKEILKINSNDKETIIKYENLPFINGLVDNFIDYKEDNCALKEWTKKFVPEILQNLSLNRNSSQYKGILNFICKNEIYFNQLWIKDIKIYWRDYQEKFVGSEVGDIIPHVWCDFFTKDSAFENMKETDNTNKKIYLDLLDLPDGFITRSGLHQIAETLAEKVGFSAQNPRKGSRISRIFDLSNFFNNFSKISRTEDNNYLIDGRKEVRLPHFLNNYNSEKWVEDKLKIDNYIYYSELDYLNKILLKKYQKSQGCTDEELVRYINDNLNKLMYTSIDENQYFIKIIN